MWNVKNNYITQKSYIILNNLFKKYQISGSNNNNNHVINNNNFIIKNKYIYMKNLEHGMPLELFLNF